MTNKKECPKGVPRPAFQAIPVIPLNGEWIFLAAESVSAIVRGGVKPNSANTSLR